MKGPHPCSVIAVLTPIVLFGFKSPYKCIIFFGVRFFQWLVLLSPLIIGLFILVRGFLGCCFLGCLFLGRLFRLVRFARSAALVLLQGVDLCAHCRDLKELISALIAMIFSCSSVGLPQAFSSSNRCA